MGKIRIGIGLAFALLVATPAQAGITAKSLDIVQVIPFLGAEYAHIGTAGVSIAPGGAMVTTSDFSSTGFTFGGVVGVRLAPISLGLLLQRSTISNSANAEVSMNKVYGEFGINAQYGSFLWLVHFDFGYAFIGVPGGADSVKGFGGKIGTAVDFYPTSLLSLGAGIAFDGQGYDLPGGLIGAYGGTFVFRIGLHI